MEILKMMINTNLFEKIFIYFINMYKYLLKTIN